LIGILSVRASSTASCCIAAFVIVGITYGVIASMSEARNVAETQRKINAFEPLLPATTMPPPPLRIPELAPQLSPGLHGSGVRRLERITAPPLLAAVKPAATQPEVAAPAAIEDRTQRAISAHPALRTVHL
jgi:hypothetical protein